MAIIDSYLKDNIRLIKSLVIKINDVNFQVNEGLKLKYGSSLYVSSTNIGEHKYFLNMLGEYHKTDNLVKVKLLETNEIVTLTKTILNKYPDTKKELKQFGNFYKETLLNNPGSEMLIKGIIFPVEAGDIHKSNYTILNYDKELVGDNELSIIYELQEEVHRFMNRWHNRHFLITDEFYLPGLLAGLYNNLLLKLINIRQRNSKSYAVNDYFINEYFKNNLNLFEDITFLNKESKLWLYKNLDYHMDNFGTGEVFNSYINNILKKNAVTIKQVILKAGDVVNDGLIKIGKRTLKLRNLFSGKEEGLGLTTLSNKQSDSIDDITLMNELNLYNSNLNSDTKTYLLEGSPTTLDKVFDFRTTYMDILVYNINKPGLVNYRNVNDGTIHNLTYKESFLLLSYYLLSINKMDTNIPLVYRYDRLLDVNKINSEYLFSNNIKDKVSEIIDTYPSSNIPILTKGTLKTLGTSINKFWFVVHRVKTNQIQEISKATFEIMFQKKKYEDTILITDNLHTYINNNLSKLISTVNEEMVVELFKSMFDLELSKLKELDVILDSFVNMTNKLTTYTTQILPVYKKNELTTTYNHNGVFYGDGPLAVKTGKFVCLEKIPLVLSVYARNTMDKVNYSLTDDLSLVWYKKFKITVNIHTNEFYQLFTDTVVTFDKCIIDKYSPIIKASSYVDTKASVLKSMDGVYTDLETFKLTSNIEEFYSSSNDIVYQNTCNIDSMKLKMTGEYYSIQDKVKHINFNNINTVYTNPNLNTEITNDVYEDNLTVNYSTIVPFLPYSPTLKTGLFIDNKVQYSLLDNYMYKEPVNKMFMDFEQDYIWTIFTVSEPEIYGKLKPFFKDNKYLIETPILKSEELPKKEELRDIGVPVITFDLDDTISFDEEPLIIS